MNMSRNYGNWYNGQFTLPQEKPKALTNTQAIDSFDQVQESG